MAAYDLQEQEQIDDLKAWWARWGGTISTGLLLGALVVLGIQGWRWYSGTRAAEASTLYQALSESARKSDAARAKDAVAQLEDKFSSTGYAARGALLYARMLYDSGDKAGAKAQLQWVIDHATEDELKAIARYRLAQAQVDEGAFDQALATLDAKRPDSFEGLYADLRGDALAAAGRVADARKAYETAVAKLDSKSQYQQYVRVKLDALGPAAANGASAKGAAAAGAAAAGAAPSGGAAATGTSATSGSATSGSATSGSASGAAASGPATSGSAASGTAPVAPPAAKAGASGTPAAAPAKGAAK